MTLTAEESAGQSLARGTAGTALLHIERALTGSEDWASTQRYIRAAMAGRIDVAEHAGLYYGLPAIAFVLHAAASGGPDRYRAAAEALDEHLLHLTHRRLTTVTRRIERGESATFAEFDLFYGLTGIGALLLRRTPGSDALAGVLRYVVGLTKPRREDGLELPGWWVAHDPDENLPTPGGHANFGMAHGAAGLLALLALATIGGCVVDGQAEALACLAGWFDRWRQDCADGPWWPQWVTRDELRTGRPAQHRPGRPSWCYGTVGIARAQQLAAIATDDPARRTAAEYALDGCLSDQQLDRIAEPGLCHGMAGIYQTACRAARDATSPGIGQRLPELVARLARHVTSPGDQDEAGGLLTGGAGVALALETTRHTTPPRSGWDACLLIT
ncbi:MAG: lanthionine synthetase C family protein [Pseudonocardiaceae bacterium]